MASFGSQTSGSPCNARWARAKVGPVSGKEDVGDVVLCWALHGGDDPVFQGLADESEVNAHPFGLPTDPAAVRPVEGRAGV